MRAMRAKGFTGYADLKLVDFPKPQGSDGKVLVRMTAAGVTPLDHTILDRRVDEAARHNSSVPATSELQIATRKLQNGDIKISLFRWENG
jgi:NADPH:quinone reductase-like Zn-dependent oxidoreductase